MEDIFEGYKLIVDTKVDWGDMDAFQHVNNCVYFKYFENARVVYGERTRIVNRMYTEKLGPILSWIDCKFIRPLTYPDTARVGIRAASVEGPELKMDYRLVSERQGIVAAAGSSLGVFYDYGNRKKLDIPQDVIEAMEELEGRALPRSHS
ncbi:MAG: Acyl-ACP thioesterase [bacterium ADurb.Bin236]|nr:MAG: Acyl-ACP thioesterase [bacterium ADurb.Bin236]HOY62269.1 thioesterase family protein [bacterium]